MNPPVLTVHLEGMDLAGKTTACQHLASALGGCLVRRNSLVAANPVYDLADRLRKDGSVGEVALGQLYAAALAVDLERYTPPKETVIQDSTLLLRSLAYHIAAGNAPVAKALAVHLSRHPRFTRSIVLTASLETRRRRLQRRWRESPGEVAADDLQILIAPERFLAMERMLVALARRHFDALVIDTSDLAPEVVTAAVLAALPGW